jgi:hypothetical protein
VGIRRPLRGRLNPHPERSVKEMNMGLFGGIFGKKETSLADKIRDWLAAISKEEKLPTDIKAICIGLFESEPNYQVYFIASKTYDPENDDWACNQDFEVTSKYLDTGIPTSKKWETFQSLVVDAVKGIRNTDQSSVLQKVEHVSVGFDSGDLTKII